MMTKEELKESAMRYFSESWKPEEYIQKLLPHELEFMKQQNRVNIKPSRILIQLIGFSWDPLFISLCLYKPEKLVLILNKFYDGKEGAAKRGEYIEFIEKLRECSLIERKPEICPQRHEPLKNDTPEEVFQFLQEHILPLLNRGEKAVIDITGAKKSMVSGAYLFASYTNCPVSYVDYDEYSEFYRRPFGYTCKINELENPSELFRLHDWERVRNMYGQYSFKQAVELIEDIRKGTERFSIQEPEHVDWLEKCLEFYGLWDNGDYRSAWNEYQKLANNMKGLPCPLAVEKLHEIWPDRTNLNDYIKKLEGQSNIGESIYLKEDEIVTYSRDELKKIERLIEINEDFRSALLRAAGMNEFLLKARIVKLWIENNFVLEINGEEYSRKDIEQNKLLQRDQEILKAHGKGLFLSLRWRVGKKNYAIRLNWEDSKEIKGHRSQNAQTLKRFWDGFSDLGRIFELRNKAIHFCLCIPQKDAVDATKVARANLADLETNWIRDKIPEGSYEALPWDELLDICDINFLPRKGAD